MNDQTASPSPPAAPAAAAPAGAPAVSSPGTPAAATRPEWMPETYWDPQANAPKFDDFGKHYVETAANAQKFHERMAGVPPNPEGYKVEVKLPDDVKVPEGVKIDPSKDPRLPVLLKTAHKLGWTNADVNELVALDARLAIENHGAEKARIAEENKKLGEKANDRVAAVTNWVKGLKEKGDLTADEVTEARMAATTAAGVSLLEKLMAKANGGIPGHVQTPPPKPPEQPLTDRWYGNQQKAS